MALAPVFISHRVEYAAAAHALEKVIEDTSQGQVQAFVSEEIPRGKEWRQSIEQHLRTAQGLFLIYGAPYVDWSWCFYEAGFFAALEPTPTGRHIYCLIRPNITPPSPLSHLQMVTAKDELIKTLMDLYRRNQVSFDSVELRT